MFFNKIPCAFSYLITSSVFRKSVISTSKPTVTIALAETLVFKFCKLFFNVFFTKKFFI